MDALKVPKELAGGLLARLQIPCRPGPEAALYAAWQYEIATHQRQPQVGFNLSDNEMSDR